MRHLPILIIDDEPSIRSVLRTALTAETADVVEAANAEEGLAAARNQRLSMILLDLGLPDQDGVALCRALRAASAVPILVVSARHSDEEKARALDAGADDYITKPFSTMELLARVRAQLRRARMAPVDDELAVIQVGTLVIDLERRTVTKDAQPVHLTPTEWELLRVLLAHRGRTVTHTQLFEAVWARGHGDAQQYLRVYVAHLRRKIEQDPLRPSLVVTEAGVGYRFALDA
ncbi:MAG: response regulator transcription factor [Gemmatimonadaceae bacterium]|nr:response regulator transcription factor [Gemmatimonadaceae bacterium]